MLTFALQIFDVCDVSDHDGGDELCDRAQCIPEDLEHSHNDRHSPKGKNAEQPNTSLNAISSEEEVHMDLFAPLD